MKILINIAKLMSDFRYNVVKKHKVTNGPQSFGNI